jgi:hypothetical protein
MLTTIETIAVTSCAAGNLMLLIAGLLAWRLLRRRA